MIVLVVSIVILVPIGGLMRSVLTDPGSRIFGTLVVSFALTSVLTYGLRRQFLRTAATSEWILRPTTRPPGRHCAAAVQKLSTAGFAISDVVAVENEKGQTMTRPMTLMHRHHDNVMVTAHSLGAHAITRMPGGWWLITSSTAVVRHPSLLVQPAKKRDPLDVVGVHTAALDLLASSGIAADAQPSPLDAALRLEQMEQESLRMFRDRGNGAPSNSSLTDRGAVLTAQMVQQLIATMAVGAGASHNSDSSCAILRE